MERSRWLHLMNHGETKEIQLTAQEIAHGWHFCWEWDGLLVGPGMGELECCECLPEALLSELKSKLPKDSEEKVLTETPF